MPHRLFSDVQVSSLQQQLEAAQQDVMSSHTAHQQVAAQLEEAVNEKGMLQQQLEALGLRGQAGSRLCPCFSHCESALTCHHMCMISTHTVSCQCRVTLIDSPRQLILWLCSLPASVGSLTGSFAIILADWAHVEISRQWSSNPDMCLTLAADAHGTASKLATAHTSQQHAEAVSNLSDQTEANDAAPRGGKAIIGAGLAGVIRMLFIGGLMLGQEAYCIVVNLSRQMHHLTYRSFCSSLCM